MNLPPVSFMASETAEARRAVARAPRENASQLKAVGKLPGDIKPSHILTCARGSSYHAAEIEANLAASSDKLGNTNVVIVGWGSERIAA